MHHGHPGSVCCAPDPHLRQEDLHFGRGGRAHTEHRGERQEVGRWDGILFTWLIVFYLSDLLKFFYSRFDPSGRGELTDKEMYNVLKIMNKIDISQEQAGPLTFDNFCYFVVFCRFSKFWDIYPERGMVK